MLRCGCLDWGKPSVFHFRPVVSSFLGPWASSCVHWPSFSVSDAVGVLFRLFFEKGCDIVLTSGSAGAGSFLGRGGVYYYWGRACFDGVSLTECVFRRRRSSRSSSQLSRRERLRARGADRRSGRRLHVVRRCRWDRRGREMERTGAARGRAPTGRRAGRRRRPDP